MTLDRDELLALLADGCCSVKEGAAFLSIGLTTAYAEMEAGRLPYCKIGRRRVIPKRCLSSMRRQWFAAAGRLNRRSPPQRAQIKCGAPTVQGQKKGHRDAPRDSHQIHSTTVGQPPT